MQDAFEQAKELHAAGKLDEAVSAYRQVVAADPEAIKAWNNLGTVLEQQEALESAAECYQRALAIDASHSILHYNLGHVMHRMERVPEAVGHYLKAVELNPQAVAAQFNLGLVMYDCGDWAAAEAAFRDTLHIAPDAVRAHHCLGELLFEQRRPEEALPFFQRTAELEPEDPEYQFNLGKCLRSLNRSEEAFQALQRSLNLNPRSQAAFEHMVGALLDLGRQAEAAAACRQRLAEDPEDPIARHRLASLSGQDVPSRASDEYVQRTYDAFAGNFDATLDALYYQGPKHVAELLQQCVPAPAQQYDVLDAGCGTGQCGVLLRPYSRRLTGVDLSGQMLHHANQRDLYDDLLQGELTGHLQRHPAAYDLIVAADTLIYFGALDEVSAAVTLALRPGGWLIFTVEQETSDNRDWSLQANGRYCHSETYIRETLEQAGMQVETLQAEVVRSEGTQSVSGWMVAARLPVAP